MRKKILAISLTAMASLSLIGCSKSDNFSIEKSKSDNQSNFHCYQTKDGVDDENGSKTKTFYFANDTDKFELTYKVLNNFTISDFYCGTGLITNDSYGYNRYMVVDSKGYELIPYDTYKSLIRIGKTKYFEYKTSDKADAACGIVDESGKIIADESYISISAFPTDKTTIFICYKDNSLCDLRAADGHIICENVPISDEKNCYYCLPTYASENCGIIAVENESNYLIISEKSGEILVDNADYVDESLVDGYKTSRYSTENLLCFFSNDGTKLYKTDEEFASCRIFSLKDGKYLYNENNLLVAIYGNSGSIREKPSKEQYVYPISTKLKRSVLIESEDKYSLKNNENRESAKFDKATYTFDEQTSFGFTMLKDDSYTLYDVDGKTLYENVQKNTDGYEKDDISIVPVGTFLIEKPIEDRIGYTNEEYGICITSNIDSGKSYVRSSNGILSEYNTEDILEITDTYGYIIIHTTEGYCNTSGQVIYTIES